MVVGAVVQVGQVISGVMRDGRVVTVTLLLNLLTLHPFRAFH